MNIRASLKRKTKTIRMQLIERDEGNLVESEEHDLDELIAEVRDNLIEYIKELGAEEVVARLGPDHWALTDDEPENPIAILDTINELIK